MEVQKAYFVRNEQGDPVIVSKEEYSVAPQRSIKFYEQFGQLQCWTKGIFFQARKERSDEWGPLVDGMAEAVGSVNKQ